MGPHPALPLLLLLLASSLSFAQELTLTQRASFTDPSGRTHTRMQLRYQGLRVWGAETIRHSGSAEEPLPAAPANPDLTPSVPIAAAHAAIRAHLGDDGASASLTTLETVLYPLSEPYLATAPGAPVNAAQVFHTPERYALAYLVRAETAGPGWDYLLDAHSGQVLARVPLQHTGFPAVGVGNTLYSGKVKLDTENAGFGFSLIDSTRGGRGGNEVVDLEHKPIGAASAAALQSEDDNNIWGDGLPQGPNTAAGSATDLTVLADAAYGLQCTWDYFARIHQRGGWDGLGTAMTVNVHAVDPTGKLMDNAYYQNGTGAITITDPVKYWPQSDLFTVAHEFGHAVNDSSARLVYSGESGGLNESNSDILGVMTSAWVANGSGSTIGDGRTPWVITTNLFGQGDSPIVRTLRSMILPSSDGRSLDEWNPGLARLDPHFASGPMNRAFYFLSQGASASQGQPNSSELLPRGMTGIGNDKAARIWYRALTTYLQPRSTYLNARNAVLRAAVDLYQSGSAENIAVRKAFGAINVGDPAAGSDDFEAPKVSAKAETAGDSLVLTATATDNDRVTGVQYFIDGVPMGQATADPYRVTLNTARLLANGGHTLVAKALDPSGNEGSSDPVSFTLANATQQLLQDPGLELRDGSPWTGAAQNRPDPTAATFKPHAGQGYAILTATGDSVAQRVTIPAGIEHASLRFWAWISDDAGPDQGSVFKVQVRSIVPAGQQPQVLATPVSLSNQDAWEDWRQYSADLTAFAGQSVELRFLLEKASEDAAFRLDDITLLAGLEPVTVQTNPGRLVILPGAASDPFTATVTGSSDQTVLWSVRESAGGSFDGGVYTAPGKPGYYHLLATAEADPDASAEVSILVAPRINPWPRQATVETGGSRDFRLVLGVGVEVVAAMREGTGAGSVLLPATGGLRYSAPAQAGTYHLDISERSDPSSLATITVTVVDAVKLTVNPAQRTLAVGSSGNFFALADGSSTSEASFEVAEGSDGGSVAADPDDPDLEQVRYTAPMVPGTYHLVATSTRDPLASASATITVVAAMAIDPPQARLLPAGVELFSATRPGQGTAPSQVTWSASGGSITGLGFYTAPATPGDYRITATAGDGSAVSVTVTVRAFDPDGKGLGAGDFGNLAVMADDYGTVSKGDPADLNGDGVVDDVDLKLAKAAFEGAGPGGTP